MSELVNYTKVDAAVEVKRGESEKELFYEWRERLGLQDWVIKFKYNCKSSELENTDAIGEVQFMTDNKTAIIRIISKEEYDNEDFMIPYDFEKTLVHELLHIKFGLIDKKVVSYESAVAEDVRHQLIDDLARAFVMAKKNTIQRSVNGPIVVDGNEK